MVIIVKIYCTTSKKHEKFSKAGDGKMTVELIKIMENDIKRCEEAQKSKADSENFYLLQINQMIQCLNSKQCLIMI